jgi:antitoxin component YwqK of YwqJK toxin-antitoxin module
MQKLTLFIFILFLYNCNLKEAKEIISYYETGKPEVVFYYKDKSDTSTYRKEVFFKNGKLKQTGYFKDDLKDGEFIWYYENGKKSAKITYSNGIFIDTIYHWYENGILESKNIVLKGLHQNECESCNGTIIEYDSIGQLSQKFTIIKGRLEGVSLAFRNKTDWTKSTYKNDILNGSTVEFNVDEKNNDTSIVKGQYVNNLEEGTWIAYITKTKNKEYLTYRNGKLNGERKIYDKNGQLRVKGLMKNDLMEGEVFHYDSLGVLKEIEMYKKDKLISKKLTTNNKCLLKN